MYTAVTETLRKKPHFSNSVPVGAEGQSEGLETNFRVCGRIFRQSSINNASEETLNRRSTIHDTYHYKMKVLIAFLSISFSTAFVAPKSSHRQRWMHELEAVGRREWLVGAASSIAFPSLAATAETIDYSKIQDLLGTDNTPTYTPETGKRPTYLTEPTDEFKQNESLSADFKRQALQKKAEFIKLLETIETAGNDEVVLSTTLDNMTRFVRANGGLPLGVSKEEVIKVCRRRKAKKYWPTKVEVSYQDLVLEIAYQQSPNTGRDSFQRL